MFVSYDFTCKSSLFSMKKKLLKLPYDVSRENTPCSLSFKMATQDLNYSMVWVSSTSLFTKNIKDDKRYRFRIQSKLGKEDENLTIMQHVTYWA